MDEARRAAIFDRLDEIFSGPTVARTSQSDSDAITSAKQVAGDTTEKDYQKIIAISNVTSNSKLEILHDCPKAMQLAMYKAASSLVSDDVEAVFGEKKQLNVDFAYGHAVGAGIQTYASTGSLVAAQFAAFVAWKADYEATSKRGDKSLPAALYAVEVFTTFWEENLQEWEVLILPDGKPASELSFGIDLENGYYHYGHIDIVLQHRDTKQLAVWEGKTTGFSTVDPAMYGNSNQALSYSVVVDSLSRLLGLPAVEYEVFYIVFSTGERRFTLLPFTKSLKDRAEWLQDLLLDHATLEKYSELQFYPKRGGNCINKYRRQCEWYGTCGVDPAALFPGITLKRQTSLEQGKKVQYTATLSQLIDAQRNRG